MSRKCNIGTRLGAVILALSMGLLLVPLLNAKEITPQVERRSTTLEHGTGEVGSLRSCDDPECGLGEEGGSCTACRIYHEVLLGVPEEAIVYAGTILENGVALRVTSADPETSELLWQVSVARNQILELVHHGSSVPLCTACRANVQSFEDLQITLQRIPRGVYLAYTSERQDLVRLLQTMLIGASDLPL